MKSEVKTRGKIYTPNYLVKNICDMGGYVTGKINKKHVIDNSCGDGAFLCEIVERYINDYLVFSDNKEILKNEIEKFIHGIEFSDIESEKCKENMQSICSKYGIEDVKFDVVCADTLQVLPKYAGKMDYVLGNPPYVRVHNFGESYDEFKDFEFCQGGMSDLYLVFYEVGIKMLNENGVLSYIAPSSFFTSLAGKNFRNWILETNKVISICDLKHFQPFNATTYTAIVTISNSKTNDVINYYEYGFSKEMIEKIKSLENELTIENIENIEIFDSYEKIMIKEYLELIN